MLRSFLRLTWELLAGLGGRSRAWMSRECQQRAGGKRRVPALTLPKPSPQPNTPNKPQRPPIPGFPCHPPPWDEVTALLPSPGRTGLARVAAGCCNLLFPSAARRISEDFTASSLCVCHPHLQVYRGTLGGKKALKCPCSSKSRSIATGEYHKINFHAAHDARCGSRGSSVGADGRGEVVQVPCAIAGIA